jgi:hypothetical protein
MKPLWLLLLIVFQTSLNAQELRPASRFLHGEELAKRLNAAHYRPSIGKNTDAAAPELDVHHMRRMEIIRLGIEKAREIARRVENGREFLAEIQDWSYDSQRDRYHIKLQLEWKLNQAPDHTRGLQGILSVQADGSEPTFTSTRGYESTEPPRAKMQPVFSWPLASR